MQVNDDLVRFPDAKPFIDKNSRTQTPVSAVSKELGYKVSYTKSGKQFTVVITNNTQKIQLKTGENTALVNGKEVAFDTEPMVKDGRTYVPVSFISKSFGTLLQWDKRNSIAIVSSDGKYHAPAWYAPDIIASVIASSTKYLGVPYVWGGTSPSGFDCSGFVQYLFRQQSVYLPRTANDMYLNAGTQVSSLQKGDLLFFSDAKKAPATHVGIYIGNNQFISATSSSGVKIDSLSNTYWGPRYFAAKRVAD